ncbi:MAG: AmmeMemoRadiSam system protein B [Desulfatiglans sp.]|jgi:AmmeMemoRadiSam system protein B|nr:AmmeMemoRadiSam system protein B [Desulfatiglans sp.]
MVQKPYTLITAFIFLTLTLINTYGETMIKSDSTTKTRPASVAGAFYPGDREELKRTVEGLLKNAAKADSTETIYAAMAPHAGYVYSGQIAALTFKNISDIEFDTIVIIGHDSYRDAVAYTCPVDYFETPLGKIPIDREMMERLEGFNKGIRPDTSIHIDDHTIEVQLPFLQAMNKNCKILPIMFGFPSPQNCKILADAIKKAAGDKKVFVLASSDMSHYPTYEGSNKIDNNTLDTIQSMDIDNFFKHVYKQIKEPGVPGLQTAICASGGVGTAILFAKKMGADTALVLKHANSGDVTGGDKTRVVGYSSVLFIKR